MELLTKNDDFIILPAQLIRIIRPHRLSVRTPGFSGVAGPGSAWHPADMHFVYVIKSDAHNRIYIGTTTDVTTRVTQHNQRKTRSTKPYCPWRLIYQEQHSTKREALIREKQMKTSGLIRKALREEKYQAPSSIG